MAVTEKKLDVQVIPSYLIADPSSSRKSIRSLLSQLGAKSQQVHVTEGFGDAKEAIQSKKPQVIFFDQDLVGSRIEELIELQDQSIPPGAPRALFFLTNKGSNAEASTAADDTIDAVLLRPFTFEMLRERVTTILEEKFFPKPHQQLLNQGLALFKSDQFPQSLQLFEKARELSPDVILSSYYIGLAQLKLGNPDQAKASFEQGLARNPTHYRCLLGLVELLSESKDYAGAYSLARKLAENHPIPLKKVPDFIKLSILNLKFQDILEFYKLVDGIDSVDSQVLTYMGAGLLICGLYFLRQGSLKEAVDVFKKTEVIAKGNSRILTRMMVALSKAGMESELNIFLNRMPPEVKDAPELQSARLESLRKTDPSQALKTALELISTKTADMQAFQVAVELSIQFKRKETVISDILDTAVQKFPDAKQAWDQYREQVKAPSS